MSRKLCLISVILAAAVCSTLLADAPTRAVQEELRKRNLFFGDIDGRQTPALIDALKRYQQRKGFAETGEPDADTLRSMGISAPEPEGALPDMPVLRSDRSMNNDRAMVDTTSPATQPPPVNAPAATRAEMLAWLQHYLAACQTPPIEDELAYYAERVEYFHHGIVSKADIGRELGSYTQQWPTRRYWLSGQIKLEPKGDVTIVRARLTFELENGDRPASGKANNAFTLARRPDLSWEIIGHQEERVRQASSSRTARRRDNAGSATPLDRTLRKFFGPAPRSKRR